MFRALFSKHYTFTADPLIVARVPTRPCGDLDELFSERSSEYVRARVSDDALTQGALRVASQSLYREASLQSRSPALSERIWLRTLAYLARMAYRPTPFGAFSAVALVDAGDETSLTIAGPPSLHIVPDMAWLTAFVRSLAEADETRDSVRLALSPAHRRRGDRITVYNPVLANKARAVGGQSQLEHTPVSLRATDGTAFIERYLNGGTKERGELARAIAEKFSADLERAQALISNLVKSGFLIDERWLHPLEDPAAAAIALARRAAPSTARQLEQLVNGLRETRSPCEIVPVYESAFETQRTLLPDAEPALLTNASQSLAGTLGKTVLDDLADLAWLMLHGKAIRLGKYRERFLAKYEGSHREVPLLELIDPHDGLGIPEADDFIDLSSSAHRNHRLYEIALSALKSDNIEVELDRSDIDRLFPDVLDEERFAESCEIGFEILAASNEAIATGAYRICPGNFTASTGAGRSAARFADALGPRVAERLNAFEAIVSELDEGLRAEVVVAPAHPKSLNVLVRPRVHPYEIPVGVIPSARIESIPVDDLRVGLDGDHFYVRSSRLGRRITLRETHVVNLVDGAPTIGRALSLFSRDGMVYPAQFSWEMAAQLPFLPRLRFGRIVLNRARWRFAKAGITDDLSDPVFRKRWCIPDLVTLFMGDNTLPIRLNTAAGLALLRDQIARLDDEFVILEEALPSPEECWLSDESGRRYRAEFVISAVRKTPMTRANAPAMLSPQDNAERLHGPGSSWLYYRLYCSSEEADDVLRDIISPLRHECAEAGLDRWFFLRYADPQFHLRLRVNAGQRSQEMHARLCGVFENALSKGLFSRYEVSTYARELERYGGAAALEICERLFAAQSARVCTELAEQRRFSDETRLLACVRSSLDLIVAMRNAAQRPVAFSSQRRKLTEEQRAVIKAAKRWAPAETEFDACCAQLQQLAQENRLTVSLDSILDSLLHMQCNRFGYLPDHEGAIRAVLYQVSAATVRR